MTFSVDHRITTHSTSIPVASSVSMSHYEQNQMRRDEYFPRYKCEDKVKAQFFEWGIVDATGKVDRYLVHLTELPLTQDEQSRVRALLYQLFTIIDDRIGVRFHAHELLSCFLTPSQAHEILPEIFNNLEIVGSAVNQCLGVSFFKRFTEHLFKSAFPEKNEAFIQDLINKVFTPKFECRLNQRLTLKLADLDLRLSANMSTQNGQALMCIQTAIDKMMSIIIAKMPRLEGEKESRRRSDLLNLLKHRLTGLDWDWLSTEDPQFYYHIIKNLAFNKLALITKENEHFGIINFGNSSDFVVDFVFVLNLPRLEMFPSVRIPCITQLNPATENQSLYPTGENWVQALSDTLFGCVRPDISKATEDDFKMLQCRKIKGDVNAVPASEFALLTIVREQSLNSRNKTVKKILRNHPEVCSKPLNNFPYFLAQMMKDAVDTHFEKDPLAAVALTINTCESLRGHVSYDEMEIFVREMHTYWKAHHDDHHPLYAIARLFTETSVLEKHNHSIRKLSLVKLCAFLNCQASALDESPVSVYPRKNEAQPCLEISFRGSGRTYSLMVDAQSPRTLLLDTLKYFQIAKSKDTFASIEVVIESFLPKGGFGGAWSTPMLDDLRFFDHNLEFFEKVATSSLILQQPLFGLFLLFATQAQIGESIPLEPVFIQLPLIINKIQKYKHFVFNHLITLSHDPVLIYALKKMSAYVENNQLVSAQQLIEKWIDLLSQHASTLPLAKQCFVETLHQSTLAHKEKRRDVLLKLYRQSKTIDPSFAIRLLQFIQEKSYTTSKEQLTLFDDLVTIKFTSPQDVCLLERIAAHHIQFLKRGKGNRKDDIQALKSGLAKLALFSPEAECMIQKLQTPVYAFDQEEVILRHEQIAQHVDAIEFLIATDYKMAAEGLYDLAEVIHSISPDRILSIAEKIVTRCIEDRNLVLAQVLLRHDMLHGYFLVEPEKFFTLILSFLDKIELTSLAGKEDVRTSILEKVLKAFVNNQTPRLSIDIMQRLVDLCMSVFHDPWYLLKPVPESYTRTLTQAFNSLLFALSAKKGHLHAVRLYDAIYAVDASNSNITRNASYVCESLLQLLIDQNFTKEVETIADMIITPILKHCGEANRILVMQLMMRLFEHASTASQKFAYLERLSTLGNLSSMEFLELLFPYFEKLASDDQHADALNVIRFFTGTISSENFPDSKRFHSFIGKLIRHDQWKLACDALAINPFVWDNPSFQAKQVEYANTILRKVGEDDSLSLMELKQIFRTIGKYAVSDPALIARFYERCASVIDEALAHQLIGVFTNQLMKTKNLSSGQFEKSIFIVLKALKFLPGNQVELFLNDGDFLHFCRSAVSQQVCFEIYQLIWKAFLHLVKSSKATDKQRFSKELDARFEKWLTGLGVANTTDIQEARAQLIDYYLSLNEPEMLSRAINQFAILGTQMLAVPHLKDRFNTLLRNIYTRLVKVGEQEDFPVGIRAVIEHIAQSEISPLSQSRCLKFCYNDDCHATGLKIINNCLAIKTFSREEISSLKNFNFYKYLLHVIEHLNPANLQTFEAILNNSRLRLFMDRNELTILESMMAEYYCSQSEVDGKKDSENSRKAEDYLYAKLSGIARVNHKDHFKGFAQSFFDQFFVIKEDKYLIKLTETIKQSENGVETLLALTYAMKRDLYNHFWENCDEGRTATLIKTFNDLLTEGLPKRKPISETELKHLKMWVLLQSSSERPVVTHLSREFVATLMSVLKNYPQDLFELRFLHSLMMREKASDYMHEHPDEMKRCFKTASEMIDDLKDKINPRQLYDDNKHCSRWASVLPFKEESDKKDELKIFINCAFNAITALPANEQASALDEMTSIWSEAVEKDLNFLYGTLLTYLPENHEFWMSSLKKKLTTYLDLLLQGKAQLSSSDFFKCANEAMSGLVKERIHFFDSNSTLEAKRIENNTIVGFFKDVYSVWTEFNHSASILDLTAEDRFTACDHYIRILDSFLRSLPKHISIQDPRFVTEIFLNAKLFVATVPKTSNALRAGCRAMEKRILPVMQKEFEKRCRLFNLSS